MGFDTQILELNYSAFPMFIDVIIFAIFTPLLVSVIIEELLYKISDCLDYISSKTNNNCFML